MSHGNLATTDLIFPVRGKTLAWDHSYALFGSLCRRQPRLHQGLYPLGIFPINGVAEGKRCLRLTTYSRLRLRLPSSHFADIFPLINAELELDGHKLHLDPPEPAEVSSATRLYSPWVTYSGTVDQTNFACILNDNLDCLGVKATVHFANPGPNDIAPKGLISRTRTIRGQAVRGYAVLLEDLSAEHSAIICRTGLGGRRHFGGGLFLPARHRS